jgi:predicted secreted protein
MFWNWRVIRPPEYRWKLNEARSENLRIFRIEDLGYRAAAKPQGKVMVGAPQSYRFRISLLSTGSARIAFEYVRPWEGKPIKSFEQRVEARNN